MRILVALLGVTLMLAIAAFLLLQRSPGPATEPPPAEGATEVDQAPPALRGHGEAASAEGRRGDDAAPRAPTWRLTGHIRDATGKPIPDAIVRAWLDPRGPRTRLGETTTNADGQYTLGLDALAGSSRALRATSGIVIRASKDGYHPGGEAQRRPIPLDAASGLEIELDAALEEGARVIGVVHAASGDRAHDATVHLIDEEGKGLFAATTDADGTFALAYNGEGDVEILAECSEHGLARVGPLRPAARATTDVGALHLRAGSTIEGHLLYADRTPVEGAWIYGNLIAAADAQAAHLPDIVPKQIGAETDAQGRFVLQTHRPGTYGIRLRSRFQDALDVQASSGDHGVEILLPAHRIVIRILDESGTLVSGCPSYILGWRADSREAFEAAIRGDTAADLRTSANCSMSTSGATGPDGRTQLLVEHGSAWIFTFQTEGLPPLERIIRVPDEGNETHVDIVVPRASAVGDLDLEIVDPYGAGIVEFDLELTTRLGSVLAMRSSKDAAPLVGLPAGHARLKVHAGPARHHLDRICQIRSPYFPVEVDVDIQEGKTTRISVRPSAGGWIRLHPHVEEPAADGALDDLRVEIRPTGSEDAWTYVGFFVYGEGESLNGTSELAPNVPTRIGRLFEPGAYELRLGGDASLKPLTLSVTVVAGEETSVDAHLERL